MGAHDASVLRGSPTYSAGKYGNGMSGAALLIGGSVDNAIGTVEFWFRTTSGGNVVAIGNAAEGDGYIGFFGGGITAMGLNGTISVNDGAWHHFAEVFDGTHQTIFLDGVQNAQNSSGRGMIFNPTDGSGTAIGGYGTAGGYDFVGQIDEVAFWSSAKYTANFTPSIAPIANGSTGLIALFHLEADGTDSAGSTATATGLSMYIAPASTTFNVPVEAVIYTIPPGSAPASQIVSTLTDSISAHYGGGSNTITIPTSTNFGTVAVSPQAAGTHSITTTHTGGGFTGGDPSASFTSTGSAGLVAYPTVLPVSRLQRGVQLTPTGYSYDGSTAFTLVSGPTGCSIAAYTASGQLYVVPGTAAGTAVISDGTNQVSVTVSAASPVYVAPNAAGIARYGFPVVNSSGVSGQWTGNTIEINWAGDYIDFCQNMLGISSPPEYLIESDGAFLSRIASSTIATNPTYRISPPFNSATSPAVLAHTARIWVEGAYPIGNTGIQANILGFELPAGGAILPIPTNPNTMLNLGDSISATVNLLATVGGINSASFQAAHVGFPALTAQALGLKLICQGTPSASVANILADYIAACPTPITPPPAVIVIPAGANGGVSQSGATAFLNRMIADYPLAQIYWPLLNGQTSSVAPLQAAITALGSSKVTLLDYTSGVYGTGECIDGLHPNQGAHARIAARLTSDIQADLTTKGLKYQANTGGGSSTDPGVANVRSGTAYEINGSNLTGTLTVTTSTDPGVANVRSGTAYEINGSNLTGTLVAGGEISGESLTGTVVSATSSTVTISAGSTTTFNAIQNAYASGVPRYLSWTSGANKGLVAVIAASSVSGGNLTLGYTTSAGIVQSSAGDTVQVD